MIKVYWDFSIRLSICILVFFFIANCSLFIVSFSGICLTVAKLVSQMYLQCAGNVLEG